MKGLFKLIKFSAIVTLTPYAVLLALVGKKR